jgi:hypothetical protein
MTQKGYQRFDAITTKMYSVTESTDFIEATLNFV